MISLHFLPTAFVLVSAPGTWVVHTLAISGPVRRGWRWSGPDDRATPPHNRLLPAPGCRICPP